MVFMLSSRGYPRRVAKSATENGIGTAGIWLGAAAWATLIACFVLGNTGARYPSKELMIVLIISCVAWIGGTIASLIGLTTLPRRNAVIGVVVSVAYFVFVFRSVVGLG